MKYKRILLKLSGESLAGDGEYGLSAGVLGSYASQIREIAGAGVEVLAYGCRVWPHRLELDRPVPVLLDHDAG